MGVLRDRTGKVVGAIDDGGRGCELFSCKQTDATRVRAGCQRAGVVFDGTRSTPMCSRGADYRAKVGCDGALAQLKRTIEMGRQQQQMRRYGARDAALMDDDENTQLRAALADLGILDDDIEKIIARLSDTGGIDAAPANMGTGQSESAFGGDPSGAGGGSMRSYAPTDSNTTMTPAPYAGDRRRMAADAASHVRQVMGRREQLYATGQISHADMMRPVSPPLVSAADEKRTHAMFPHAGRLGHATYGRD